MEKQGIRSGGALVAVTVRPGPGRLGLVVSKKVHNHAVERNRWKRLFREAFRLTQHELPQGVDLILIPKLGTDEPDFEALKASLVALAQQAAKKLGPKP